MLTRMNRGNWIGRLIVALQDHYPHLPDDTESVSWPPSISMHRVALI
jgi:hypothetical protein